MLNTDTACYWEKIANIFLQDRQIKATSWPFCKLLLQNGAWSAWIMMNAVSLPKFMSHSYLRQGSYYDLFFFFCLIWKKICTINFNIITFFMDVLHSQTIQPENPQSSEPLCYDRGYIQKHIHTHVLWQHTNYTQIFTSWFTERVYAALNINV